ncbi:hypothetical protein ADEAN_000608000 [Angomonas deanei]|uniref:Uncharacterized protein n=1 Tax=Angomonas deanei TaxID=59799 RepID=A0A7G2CGF9_9TRYP|nr:hypothetical protein ADEAN_000608000 [Angomonas deanei]
MPLTDVQQSACVTASWFSLQANDQRVSKALLVDIVLTYVRTGKLSFETASVWLSNVLRRWIKTFEASNGCTAEDHSVSPTTTVHTVERDQLLEEVSDVAAACVFALQSAERFGEETDDDKVPWPYFAFSVLTHLVIDITRVLKELSTTDATLFRWQYAYVRLLLQVGFAIKTDPRLTVPPDVTSTSQTENSFTGPFVLSKLKQQWSMLPAQLCHHTHAINYLCPSDIVVLDFLLL